jgi:aminopeptidase N
MKKITYLLVLLSAQIGFAQAHDADYTKMIEAEMKSAAKKMAFAVNANTQNYDMTYQKLELTVNPATTPLNISGKVTNTFRALSDMTAVTFDFFKKTTGAFTISSVKSNGTDLAFSHNSSHELVITLPSIVTTGNSATVEITYSGQPSTAQGAITRGVHAGTPVIWTLSEPYGARDWWPCKQDLNDKIDSIDIYITAPSIYITAANGLQQSRIINGANATTYFHHGYPIPAYLVAFAVTNYTVYNQQGGLGTAESPFFPIVNYIYPETAATTQTSLGVTPNIINFYETIIGDYPFRNEKYGHAQFGWGGGMEHTTVSFMGGWSRGLIAHEMAHQWFGDKITCGSWKDIWLNEGLTEYMSGLVVENFDGASGFKNWKIGKIANITSQTGGNLYLTDAQLTDVNRIFSGRITYDKGSMVTNMLRFKLGTTDFYQALNNYLSDPILAYAYALTPQFQAHLETVYGSSLQEFFNDWVYNQGYPTYNINAHNSAPGQVTVQISQTQSDPSVTYFEMPVPIRLYGALGEQLDVVLENTTNGQVFNVNVPFVVEDIEFDPNREIISLDSFAQLSTQTFDHAAAIQMYPNPGSDILNIDLPTDTSLAKVTFHNALGQNTLETSQSRIDISQLATGLYAVTLQTSNGTYHKKFIKK